MTNIAFAKTGTARSRAGRLVPLLLICLSGSLLVLGACTKDKATVSFPSPPAEEARKWLFDVYGTAANNVYTAGGLGVMYHFDGTDWTLQSLGATTPITKIWSPPTETTLYAVGHGGRIWRNNGTGWASMESGTTRNLYGVGSFGGQIHAVGAQGTIRRLNGSTWGGVGDRMMILDENGAPTDTLAVTKDLSSLLAVNNYFLGGAYRDPKFTGTRFGIAGTKGSVLAANTDNTLATDWILRPISGEALVDAEWVYCMSSDPATLDRNYLGTSEGWLFRLTRNDEGRNVWQKFYPELTDDPGAGIRDIWVDAANNVYVATDEGKIIYQTFDYNFVAGTGRRETLFNDVSSFVGIWGTAPDNIYFVGYFDEVLFHGDHDVGAGTFTVTEIDLAFPDKAAGSGSLAAGCNEFDLPLR